MDMKSRLILALFIIMIASCDFNREPVVFEYPGDNYNSDAVLDLRYLNENFAGQHGFIQLSEDRESFVREDGQPVRFWSVNGADIVRNLSDDEYKNYARFLAKMGVNMARFHGSINPAGRGTMINWVDTSEVDNIWKAVAYMKEEGIYTTISPFWAHNGHMGGWVPEEWGIEGYSGKDALWGVMYFSDTLKQAYKSWVRYLYTETNPYTGIPLKDEPAVALIQIKNEDGVFFWTMQNIKPELKRLIMKKYTDWLLVKYGTRQKVWDEWNNVRLKEDNDNVYDIYSTWEMTQEVSETEKPRMRDQVEFLMETQYNFYKEIHDFYRDDLGCKQLINANNWKTADPCRLFDPERYTYTACEVSAVNRYYAPGHYGEYSGWRIDPGDFYVGTSALKDPVKIPVNIRQTLGQPMLVTESGWNLPHKYQSEAPLLIASFMSLTGVDSYYWFHVNAEGLMKEPYFDFVEHEGGGRSMNRWTYSIPGGTFMFPANALMFRNNYIKEGDAMVSENRSLLDLYNRVIPALCEENSYDPNRDADFTETESGKGTKVNPLVFLTGKAEVEFGTENSQLFVNPVLKSLIDTEEKTVTSSTGEMSLDYGRGIFTLDTPYAKGLTGFLSGDVGYVLNGVYIKSINEYATVSIVSMDELPLENSEMILIQTGTVYRPSGWKEEPSELERNGDTIQGFRILNAGHMPWMAEPLKMHVELRNEVVNEALLLNTAGYEVSRLKLKRQSDMVILDLPDNATYVVLRKGED